LIATRNASTTVPATTSEIVVPIPHKPPTQGRTPQAAVLADNVETAHHMIHPRSRVSNRTAAPAQATRRFRLMKKMSAPNICGAIAPPPAYQRSGSAETGAHGYDARRVGRHLAHDTSVAAIPIRLHPHHQPVGDIAETIAANLPFVGHVKRV